MAIVQSLSFSARCWNIQSIHVPCTLLPLCFLYGAQESVGRIGHRGFTQCVCNLPNSFTVFVTVSFQPPSMQYFPHICLLYCTCDCVPPALIPAIHSPNTTPIAELFQPLSMEYFPTKISAGHPTALHLSLCDLLPDPCNTLPMCVC